MTSLFYSKPKLCMHAGERGCFPDIEPILGCLMPWESKSGTLSQSYSETHLTRITFGYFEHEDCGKRSVAITTHPEGGDITFPVLFRGIRWLPSAEADARFGFDNPSAADGFQQMALFDVDGTMTGTPRAYDAPSVAGYTHGGIPWTAGSTATILPLSNPYLATTACYTVEGAYVCPGVELGLLSWRPGDTGGRNFGAMKLHRQSEVDDGRATFSTGISCAGCLPCKAGTVRHWQAKTNEHYNLTLFTSMPRTSTVGWFHHDPSDAIMLTIFQSQPFAIDVFLKSGPPWGG